MQALTPTEIGIVGGVYVGALCLFALATWLMKSIHPVWAAFSSSRGALIAVIMVAATAGSVSLYFSDWVAFGTLPLVFLLAIIFLSFSYGKGTVSAVSAALIATLLCLVLAPMILTLVERDNMGDGVAVAVGTLLALFWTLGFFFSMLFPRFTREARPFAKSRPLVMLLMITMYCLWFAGKNDWGVVAVSVLGFIAFLVWIFNGNNKVLSASMSLYRENPQETAFLVVTMIFVVTLNLTISITKKVNESHKNVYLFNIILFAVTLAVTISVATIAILKSRPPSKPKSDKAEPEAVELTSLRASRT